jgi:ligand-binding sensor domain-containing protein
MFARAAGRTYQTVTSRRGTPALITAMSRLAHPLFALLGAWLPACSMGAPSPSSPRDQDPPVATAPRSHAKNEAVCCGHLHTDGSMWFGTNHEGVYRHDGTSFTHYSTSDGLVGKRIAAITHDAAGNLWFGTDRGLCRYDGKAFVTVPIPWDGNADLWGEGMNANLVLCLLCDRHGRIWFGTWGNGAHRFDPSREVEPGRYEFESFLQDEGAQYDGGVHRNVVQSIVEDRDGGIWLTSMSHGGVQRFDGQRFEKLSLADGLSDDMVLSACADRSGNLWFGMLGNRGGGLDRYHDRSFTHFDKADGLSSNNVVGIFEDRHGTLWLASHRGDLCRLVRGSADGSGSTIAPFTVAGATFDQIQFAAEDATGAVWFGGGRGRLFRFADGTLTDHTDKR